jgi:tetratricopeptide (TPR) repeat protein
MTEGWGAEQAERSFRRACEIGERLGEDDLKIPALYGLAVLLEYRAEYARSQAIMEEVLELGPAQAELRLQVHELLACSLFHQGAFADAVATADRGLAAIDAELPSLANADFGDDSAMSCHAWAALASWFLGHWDEALDRAETAVELARDPARAYCLANALSQMARVHQLRRDVGRTREAAAEAIALAERQGVAYFGAVATILHGWARALEGDAAGIEEIERGVEAHRSTGAAMDRPYFLGMLAEALAANGRCDEALGVVGEGIAAIGKGRPFFDEPELVRLEGELLLRTGSTADAEARFKSAIERSRALGARGSELRAAFQLARLRNDGGPEEARALLEPAMAGIRGGEGTQDFDAAAALLASGGRPPAPA